jgi:nucleotide-binding universal stress UspA family protein
MFDRLLIAVDGSSCARRAAKFGLELAARYDADVEVVTVASDETTLGRNALDDVEKLAAEVGVDVATERLSGKPARTIVARAAECDADLIVVGRRGRTGVRARFLGTVTERILRRSAVPVLTVPDGDVTNTTGTAFERVLVTTDGSDIAGRAGPYGSDLARRVGAALHVLNVVDIQAEAGVFNAGGVDREYVERLERRGREAVDDLVAAAETTGLDVRRAVVRGSAHEAIDEYVEENGIDLLVMSSEGQSNLASQQLGTVTGRVLRTVDRPVLVVTSD